MASKQKLRVPFGMDARLIKSRYARMLPARKRAFNAEFERFSALQQLRLDAAAQSGRAVGIKPAPASRQSVAFAKRTLATLNRLQPKVSPHRPPDSPPPLLVGPPYNAAVPVQFSSQGEVGFSPWNRAPNSATGQVGGALNTFSGGVGMATSEVGFVMLVPQPPAGLPTYEVVVQATLIGNYYLAAPAYGYAAVSAELSLDFIDLVPAVAFHQPHSIGLVSQAIAPIFSPATEWDYLNNTNLALSPPPPTAYSFQQTFLVNMADTGPAQINVGVTQKVSASQGAIAGIDIEMTVLSIGFALVN